MAVAFTMHRDERIAVASYLGTKRAYRRATRLRLLRRPHRETRRSAKSSWNGWSPGLGQHSLSIRRGRRIEPRSGPPPEAEMGLRIRWRRHCVRAAHRHRRSSIRRQRRRPDPRHARRDGLSSVGLPGQRPSAIVHRGGPFGPAARASVRRHDRLVLCASGRNRQAALEGSHRNARFDASHRRAGGLQRNRVRAGGLVGGNPRRRSRISLLYLPRKRRRSAHPRRRATVEDLHDRGSRPDRKERARNAPIRAVRRGRLVRTHRGRQARRALCDHRR